MKNIGIPREDFLNNEFWKTNVIPQIRDFFERNSDRAFVSKEVAKITGFTGKQLNYALSKLRKEKFLLHKSPYWCWNDEREDEEKEIKINKKRVTEDIEK